MTNEELRQRFAPMFAAAALHDPTEFYAAFDEGETGMVDFLTALWEQLCAQEQVNMGDHPFFPSPEFWLLDETEENFACLLVVSLPPLPRTPDCALFGVVFGAAMNVRFFTGTRQEHTIRLTEWMETSADTLSTREWGCFAETEKQSQEMAQRVYAVCDGYQPEE